MKIIEISEVQKFSDLADSDKVDPNVLTSGYNRATNKSRKSHIQDKHEDEIAYEGYVEKLKNLLIQLESEIEKKYKHPHTPFGEIAEWRAKLHAVSSVVDVYRLGWELEETIKWREEEDEEKEGEGEDDDVEYTERKRSERSKRERRKSERSKRERNEQSKRGRSRRKGDRVGNRRSGAENQIQQDEEERRRVTGEASARLSREEEREPAAGAGGGGATKKHKGKASAGEPIDNCNETPAFSVALGAGSNSGGGCIDRTSTRPEKSEAGDEGSRKPSHTHHHAAAAPPPRLSDQECAGEQQHAAAAAATTTAAVSPPPTSVATILRNPMYDEGKEELARRLAGSTQQHPHPHHNRQRQQRAVDQQIADCERSPEIGDLHSNTDSGDDLAGDKMLGPNSDDGTKEVAVGGVASNVVKEDDMNMNEMINMLDQEYVENEEKLSVSKSELDKDKSNLMSSEKEMNDMKDSIKKLNNTIKDLTQLLSPENLDLLERIVTEVRSLKQAEEQHENLKNTLSSKQEKYDFILVRRDEINQNKSEVQSAQSLMSEVAENLTAAEQLKSDLKLLQTLQVDKANRLASLLVEYEKVKAEHGELAQKCE